MKRRHIVIAAAVAGAAGLATALWRSQPSQRGQALSAAETAFWKMRFERPEGGELALVAWKGRPLLLNFWATWCAPCVTEMPLLDGFHRNQGERGVQVLGLAVDGPTPVREFLARRPMGFAIGLAGLDGIELARSLGNPSGALPFSVLFGASGHVIEQKLGALHPPELQEWASRVAVSDAKR